MGTVHEEIDGALAGFLMAQHVFFVATAPLAADGHVNLSPKGLDDFRVLGPRQVAYLDRTGSGVETTAHLRENGRIVFMFCAFDGPPRIVRLHGRGEAVRPGDPRYEALAANFEARDGARSVVVADVRRVADSCGYGVPKMDFVENRRQLGSWARKKGADGVATYQAERNAFSLDGLPGLA
ncbi:MAG: pyridoxamine 5'-phosphate oxidase family protein [Actinobacteria bacterium]|nr:pyridoxamine 5'-phosphate oxidase family protein [Actinomycetota bacterium]